MNSFETIGDFQRQFINTVSSKVDRVFADWNYDGEKNSEKQYPKYLTANLAPLIEAIEPLNLTNNTFQNVLSEINSDIKKLLVSKNPTEFMTNLGQLLQVDAPQGVSGIIKSLVKTNVDFALSFSMSFQHLSGAKALPYVEALLEYLFNEYGYETVSGKSIQAPQLFSTFKLEQSSSQETADVDINEEINAIKGMLKDLEKQVKITREQITAERYIRDIVRICVEVTGDQMYDLKTRYANLKTRHNSAKDSKLVVWFDSFGNLAEASVLPAVETILSGVGSMQLNPKIALALATFCSVTVRKATEHAYLQVIGFSRSD